MSIILQVPAPGVSHQFAVFDVLGAIVHTGRSSGDVDLSALGQGTYCIYYEVAGVGNFSELIIDPFLPSGFAELKRTLDGAVSIDWRDKGEYDALYLRVFDRSGQTAYEGWQYNTSITLDVAPGIYTLQIALPGGSALFETNFHIGTDGQLISSERPRVALNLPEEAVSYTITDTSGEQTSVLSFEHWADFTGLTQGRYKLDVTGPQQDVRMEIVVAADIPGGVVAVSEIGQSIDFIWGDAYSAPPYYLRILDATGATVSGRWIYENSATVELGAGDYSLRVSPPGKTGFDISFAIGGDGKLRSVDGVLTDHPENFAGLINMADAFAPLTFNSGSADFSFFESIHDRHVVQVRDAAGNVESWFSDEEHITVNLTPGEYHWRALGIPDTTLSNSDILVQLDDYQSGWNSFTQSRDERLIDYVLGLEPDMVETADDLALNFPSHALKLDDGSIIVTNTYGANIYRVFADGTIAKIAGAYREGYTDAGNASDALLRMPVQLLDIGGGKIWFADSQNFVIRELDVESNSIRTVFGDPGNVLVEITGGLLRSVGQVFDFGLDGNGNLFVSAMSLAGSPGSYYGYGGARILRENDAGQWYYWMPDVSSLSDGFVFQNILWHDGVISALVLDNSLKKYMQFTESGDFIGSIQLNSSYGGGLVVDPVSGDLLIGNHTGLLRIDHQTLTSSDFPFPEVFANVSLLSVAGNSLVIVDSDRGKVYDYDLAQGRILDSFGGERDVRGIYTDLHNDGGRLLAIDNQTPRVISLDEDGLVTTLAGDGKQGAAGSAKPGDRAEDTTFAFPSSVTSDLAGNIYVAESNHRILKISVDGDVSIFAGSTSLGYSGDGGQAADARFRSIYGLEFSANGSLYVADSYNHSIRRIDPFGIVTTVVGNGAIGMGEGVGATGAVLNTPLRVIVADDGRLIISDSWNNRVVEVGADGVVRAIAGVGSSEGYQGLGAFSGDGGLATLAELNNPLGLALYEADGTLFISDQFNDRVRYVDAAGDIHTLLGGGRGYANAELLNLPSDIELIGEDLYIADSGNALVLKINDVDRTGGDYASALDVGRARQRLGDYHRGEHVNETDGDFYDLSGIVGHSVKITAAETGLHVVGADAAGQYGARFTPAAGESMVLTASDFSYLIFSARTHLAYTMEVLDGAAPDRTGGDFSTALKIAQESQGLRVFDRSERVDGTDGDYYNLAGLSDTFVQISSGASGLHLVGTNSAGGFTGRFVLGANGSIILDSDDYAFLLFSARDAVAYNVQILRDLGGDDFSTALDLGRHLTAEAPRLYEHVADTDGDFYRLSNLAEATMTLTAAQSGLHVVGTDVNGAHLGRYLLTSGESLSFDAEDFAFLIVSSGGHASYDINISFEDEGIADSSGVMLYQSMPLAMSADIPLI